MFGCRTFLKGPFGLLSAAVLLALLAFQPAVAQTFEQSAGVNFPSPVTPGQTNLGAFVNTQNSSTLGGGASASITVRLTDFTLQVSCQTIPIGVCSPAGGENPPVFSIVGATGTGNAGSSCSGVVFNIAATANPGEYTLTPQTTVDLGIGQSCLVNFLIDVDGVPAVDADPQPGLQTVQTVFARGVVVAIDGVDTEPGVGTSTSGSGQFVSTILADCEVELDKQVSCDGGATWYSFDFGDSGNPQEFCQGFAPIGDRPADDIMVRYFARRGANTSAGVVLQNCVLTDAGQSGNPVAWIPPDASGIDLTGPDPVQINGAVDVGLCTATLDDDEPNTATLTCDCAVNDTVFDTATDTDSAEFRCDTCDINLQKISRCEQNGGTFTAFGDGCSAWNAFDNEPEPHPAERVQVAWTGRVVGSVGVVCTPTEVNPGHGLSDTNDELLAGSFNTGSKNPGPAAVLTAVQRFCSDTLDDAEPDTATWTCLCKDRTGATTDIVVSASDDSNFNCLSPVMDITKVCDPQVSGNNDIDVQACNAGTANLVNCSATDTVYTEDPLCDDGLTGATTDVPLTPVPFDLPAPVPGAPPTCATLDGTVPGLLDDACNNVTVTCDVEGSGEPPKTITASAQDECEVQGDECLTRTPGFWGTHPNITQQVLDAEIADATPIINCGVNMTNTTASTPGSATEDMCSVGKDPKTNHVLPQQVQLERQCMAALLNVAATEEFFEASCDNAYPGTAQLIAECCTSADSVCVSALANGVENPDGRTLTSCIGDLDAFNNSSEAEPDPAGSIFESPGPADPTQCKASKNNGYLNARPRAPKN